jgi:hypothetical protein
LHLEICLKVCLFCILVTSDLLKLYDRISKKTTLVFLSRSPTPSFLIVRLSRPSRRLSLSPSRRTSTTVSSSRLCPSMTSSPRLSRTVLSAPVTISSSVLVSLLMSMVGMSPMLARSGVSVPTPLVLTCWSMSPRECST